MGKKGLGAQAAGSKKRKGRQEEEEEEEEEEGIDWDALLGEEVEGGVDLDEMGRIMVDDSKIR